MTVQPAGMAHAMQEVLSISGFFYDIPGRLVDITETGARFYGGLTG